MTLLFIEGLGLETLVNFGTLGIFSLLMIYVIVNQSKKDDAKTEKIIGIYEKILESHKSEINDLKKEKDEGNNLFIKHLENSEAAMLKIISEHTTAYNSFEITIKSLINSIEKRDVTTIKLHETIVNTQIKKQ